MFDVQASTFGAVAVHLVEAACSALDGDSENAKARIASAMALLQGELTAGVAVLQSRNKERLKAPRGGLTIWQARRIAAHIDSNLTGKVHVDALARLVGLSAGHFSREFKRSFGVSPHSYLVRRRIEVAQSLMLTTRDSLSDIALSCGM